MSISSSDVPYRAIKHPRPPSTILVVEQDQTQQETITSVLREDGYAVRALTDITMIMDIARDSRLALTLLILSICKCKDAPSIISSVLTPTSPMCRYC